MHCNFRIQFFFNLSFQRLLWRFTRFDFSARKFPLAFVVTMVAGGRINFMFYMLQMELMASPEIATLWISTA